jgi:hypothetical protein
MVFFAVHVDGFLVLIHCTVGGLTWQSLSSQVVTVTRPIRGKRQWLRGM